MKSRFQSFAFEWVNLCRYGLGGGMNGGMNGGGMGGGMGGVGKPPLYPGQGGGMQGGYNGGLPTPDSLMPSYMGGAESSGGASSPSSSSGLPTITEFTQQ